MGLQQLLLFTGLIVIAGAGGYAGALTIVGEGEEAAQTRDVDSSPSVMSAGQFSIPLFDEDRIVGVLLAQINIEASNFQQLQVLSRSKPQVRSTIIETFFAMEREGVISPARLDPVIVASRIKTDLEMVLDEGEIGGVLIDRLLLQESGRASERPGLRL